MTGGRASLSDAAVASDNFGHCTKSRTPAAAAVETVAALRAWLTGHIDGFLGGAMAPGLDAPETMS